MSYAFGFSSTLFEAANLESRRRSEALSRSIGKKISPAKFGGDGATQGAIQAVQEYLGHTLAPDLLYLAERTCDPDGTCMRWMKGPSEIQAFREWVLEGLRFDVLDNGLWLASWGERPESPKDRIAKLESEFETWPKLLPLNGHRAIPASPCEAGNPIFSIMQSDIIYYGATLADWMALDLTASGHGERTRPSSTAKVRHIPIWSDFAEQTDGFTTEFAGPVIDEIKALFKSPLKPIGDPSTD